MWSIEPVIDGVTENWKNFKIFEEAAVRSSNILSQNSIELHRALPCSIQFAFRIRHSSKCIFECDFRLLKQPSVWSNRSASVCAWMFKNIVLASGICCQVGSFDGNFSVTLLKVGPGRRGDSPPKNGVNVLWAEGPGF